MDRKKQLLTEYKHRKTEMGIVSFLCVPTKESFIGLSQDTKAYINSNHFKLDANLHHNIKLQKLWKQYGESDFKIGVLEVLPYDVKDDVKDNEEDNEKVNEKIDYAKKLESMCNNYIRNIKLAMRL